MCFFVVIVTLSHTTWTLSCRTASKSPFAKGGLKGNGLFYKPFPKPKALGFSNPEP